MKKVDSQNTADGGPDKPSFMEKLVFGNRPLFILVFAVITVVLFGQMINPVYMVKSSREPACTHVFRILYDDILHCTYLDCYEFMFFFFAANISFNKFTVNQTRECRTT